MMNNFGDKVSFIWSVADLLRGPYRPNQYKDVMLPLTVLRRLDCVLEPTKDKVLAELNRRQGGKIRTWNRSCAGSPVSPSATPAALPLKGSRVTPTTCRQPHPLPQGLLQPRREIIDHFGFEEHIAKLDKADRPIPHRLEVRRNRPAPDTVTNIEMAISSRNSSGVFNEPRMKRRATTSPPGRLSA